MISENQELLQQAFQLNTAEQEAIDYWAFVLQNSDTEGLLKGGFIRDKITSCVRKVPLVPHDVDLFVIGGIHRVLQSARQNGAELVERRWRKSTPVFKFRISRFEDLSFEVGVVLGDAYTYDSADFHSIRLDDAGSTDLDVNAMSLRLSHGERSIFDPFDAFGAIGMGEVSLINKQSLYKNPENIFRAYRIADRLHCQLSVKTLRSFAQHGHVVSRIKRPFLVSQLKPILDSKNADCLWEQMTSAGVTRHILSGSIRSLGEARELLQ